MANQVLRDILRRGTQAAGSGNAIPAALAGAGALAYGQPDNVDAGTPSETEDGARLIQFRDGSVIDERSTEPEDFEAAWESAVQGSSQERGLDDILATIGGVAALGGAAKGLGRAAGRGADRVQRARKHARVDADRVQREKKASGFDEPVGIKDAFNAFKKGWRQSRYE